MNKSGACTCSRKGEKGKLPNPYKIKEVLVALSRMFNKWTPVLGLLTSTRAAVKVVNRSFEGKKKKKENKDRNRNCTFHYRKRNCVQFKRNESSVDFRRV